MQKALKHLILYRIENENGNCIKETKKNTKERNSKSRPAQFYNRQTPL